MTNEERDLITRFIERVGGAGGAGGSVPNSQALPPVDPAADALIGELLQRHPEARYRITQLAFVQEQALNAAQQRIQTLQQQLQQAQQQTAASGGSPWGGQAGAQGQPQQPRGFLSSLFGGGSSAPQSPPQPQYQPPPQQQYAPQYAPPPGMMQQQGSGFLGGALRTAAGVAGGLVAGQALMGLFEGHGSGGFGSNAAMPGGGFGGGFGGGNEAGWVGGGEAGAAGGGFVSDPGDQGGALKDAPASDPFAGGQQVADNSGWTPAPDQGGGWQQPAADDGGWQQAAPDAGGWDSGSSGGDDGGGWTDSSSDA